MAIHKEHDDLQGGERRRVSVPRRLRSTNTSFLVYSAASVALGAYLGRYGGDFASGVRVNVLLGIAFVLWMAYGRRVAKACRDAD